LLAEKALVAVQVLFALMEVLSALVVVMTFEMWTHRPTSFRRLRGW
jgi:hypothetical protein